MIVKKWFCIEDLENNLTLPEDIEEKQVNLGPAFDDVNEFSSTCGP